MAYRILIALTVSLISHSAMGNSCCGQSPASFTVLSLNQRLTLSTGVSYLRSQGRVRNNSNEFHIWDGKKREVRSLSLNAASAIADRHQLFLNTSVLEGRYSDEIENESTTNMADTLIGYTFEALPEYSFSYWKPIIYLTAFLNLPTGRSIYETGGLSEGADVTGHGQWGTGLGVTLRKVYFPWTITLQGRTIRLLSKKFGNVNVSSFYDSSVALLLNYSSRWWNLQFNGGLTFSHLSERTIQSNVTSGMSQNFTVLGGLQRSISESWVAGLNLSDQTLVGPAKNTVLNRSINLNFNYSYF